MAGLVEENNVFAGAAVLVGRIVLTTITPSPAQNRKVPLPIRGMGALRIFRARERESLRKKEHPRHFHLRLHNNGRCLLMTPLDSHQGQGQ